MKKSKKIDNDKNPKFDKQEYRLWIPKAGIIRGNITLDIERTSSTKFTIWSK